MFFRSLDKVKITIEGKARDYYTNNEIIVTKETTGEIWGQIDSITFVVKTYINNQLHYLRISAPYLEKIDETIQKELKCECGGKKMGYKDFSKQHLTYCELYKNE